MILSISLIQFRQYYSTSALLIGIPTLAAYSLPAHSVYELAALTQDLDTQGMTTKIKEVLLANNIGQKVLFIIDFVKYSRSTF